MRVLADLYEGVESLTPYGGRAVSWEPLGVAWLKLGPRRMRQSREASGARTVETLTAESRPDPRLTRERMLRFGGADWRIRAVETVGGRAILRLERSA